MMAMQSCVRLSLVFLLVALRYGESFLHPFTLARTVQPRLKLQFTEEQLEKIDAVKQMNLNEIVDEAERENYGTFLESLKLLDQLAVDLDICERSLNSTRADIRQTAKKLAGELAIEKDELHSQIVDILEQGFTFT